MSTNSVDRLKAAETLILKAMDNGREFCPYDGGNRQTLSSITVDWKMIYGDDGNELVPTVKVVFK